MVIQTSPYLYNIYKHQIPLKRKKSLTKFIEADMKKLKTGHKYSSEEESISKRGHRLPNGKLEGKYETISISTYKVSNYINGELEGITLCYAYIYNDRGKVNYIKALGEDFVEWKKINIDSMILEYRRDKDNNAVSSPDRPTRVKDVTIPTSGEFIFKTYPDELYEEGYIYIHRYMDGIITDTWNNIRKGQDNHEHITYTAEAITYEELMDGIITKYSMPSKLKPYWLK